MSQPTLFTPPPGDGNLTDRQQTALDHLRAIPAGDTLTAAALGVHVHAVYGNHRDDHECPFCRAAGLELLRALKKRGLVVQRRHGWQAASVAATPRAAATAEQSDPFPPGY